MLSGLEYSIFIAKLTNRILIIDLNHIAYIIKSSLLFLKSGVFITSIKSRVSKWILNMRKYNKLNILN
jgi:hypothetical protein